MDQPSSSDLPNHFSVSLPNAEFMSEESREDGPNNLSMPGFSHGRPADNFGLQLFYMNNDDPWTSLVNTGSSSQTNRQNQALAPYYPPTYDFSDYRSADVPSESGTLPADSGYGSHRPQYSVASNSSIHEDEGTLDPQITERLLHLGGDPPTFASHTQGQSDYKFQCRDCKHYVRTRSELNKHIQRHRKPYQCPYPNCSRREGFSTKNDLARHKKTVHKEHDGNGPIYICRDGACADKGKLWPRADNFRQHLSRVHRKELRADDDLSPYIHQSSPSREDLKGIGSSVGHLDHNSHPQQIQDQGDLFSTSIQSRAKSPLPYQGSQSVPQSVADLDNWPGPIDRLTNSLAEPSEITQTDKSKAAEVHSKTDGVSEDQQLKLPTVDAPSTSLGNTLDVYATPDAAPNRSTSEEMDVCETIDLTNEDSDGPMDEQVTVPADSSKPAREPQQEAAEAASGLSSASAKNREELMKYLASVPREALEIALKDRKSEDSKIESELEKHDIKPQNRCSECQKSFNRPCELKKHMKRHEKPYGCTFRNCQKEFGSKNDWKRHESSQHYQLETWNCEEDGCKKVCHRREGFKNHLQKDHSLDNAKALEEKLERCRMGRHCDPRFWCGFCVKVVEIQETDVNSWTKRCDHIDNHLMGRDGLEKKRSSDWEYLEDQQPPESPRRQSQDTNASTSSSSSTSKAASRRRKASPDRNPQIPKRKRVATTYMWRCHHCGGSFNNLRTTSNCIDCNHYQCIECDVDLITPEDEGEQFSQRSNLQDSEGGNRDVV